MHSAVLELGSCSLPASSGTLSPPETLSGTVPSLTFACSLFDIAASRVASSYLEGHYLRKVHPNGKNRNKN